MDSSNKDLGNLDQFSIKEELTKYLIHWKWLLASVLVFVLSGFVYLKLSKPVYNIISTILIKDTSEGRGLSEIAAFQDLTSFSGGTNDIDDEVDIIKSKTLISKVVKELELNIIQQSKINFKNVDLYGFSPLEIHFKPAVGPLPSGVEFGYFGIKIIDSNKFELFDPGYETTNVYAYGEVIKHPFGNLVISKSLSFESNLNEDEPIIDIDLFINNVEIQSLSFRARLAVVPKNKRSSLLDLSIKDSNKQKSYDFLNTLIETYNKEAISDKNLVSRNTLSFIEDRLIRIKKELGDIEDEKSQFKQDKGITDISSESKLFIEQIGSSQDRILGTETQLDLTKSMLQYLEKKDYLTDLLPANIGLSNTSLNSFVGQFNKLILERKRLLESSTELNPLVQDITNNILVQRENLIEALKNQLRNLEISKKELLNQKGKISGRIKDIPQIEKSYRVIARQQQIKENLYLFLLKKKEDLSISMTVTAPPAKIIDRAYSYPKPVKPKAKFTLIACLVLGLLIPISFIYVLDLLNTKVNDRKDVESALQNTPLLVEIARVKKGVSDVLKINDRSVLGESFRILRTNLNYLGKSKKKEGKALKVFITSTVKGEGKTFVSFNTVLALADSNKKILVIGADVRNPQLHRYLKNDKNARGLSDYLYDNTLTFEEIVNTINFNNHNIDYVTSGRIPPNPSELLMNGRLEELLDYLDENHDYDYIIVDTAPTMLVTDTLIICESADVTIYVVRANYTDKNLLNYASQLKQEGKINNMAIVLNDVKEGRIGYGYSYGYGETKKKWYQKILKS